VLPVPSDRLNVPSRRVTSTTAKWIQHIHANFSRSNHKRIQKEGGNLFRKRHPLDLNVGHALLGECFRELSRPTFELESWSMFLLKKIIGEIEGENFFFFKKIFKWTYDRRG
jgi:hypothetical protein